MEPLELGNDAQSPSSDSEWFENRASKSQLASGGIYAWHIENVGVYIGKSVSLGKRMRRYPNNVRRKISGKSYRSDKPERFREVHLALTKAFQNGVPVYFEVIETCSRERLKEREEYWIAHWRAIEVKGGVEVLNRTPPPRQKRRDSSRSSSDRNLAQAPESSTERAIERIGPKLAVSLRAGWFLQSAKENQLDLPGIFEWQIDGHEPYVGSSERIGSTLERYEAKVRRLVGKNTKPSDGAGSVRDIYRDLVNAYLGGVPVRFSVLENCDLELLGVRKQFWKNKVRRRK